MARRPRSPLLRATVVLLATVLVAPSPGLAQVAVVPRVTLGLAGLPLLRDDPGDGVRVRVTLAAPAHLRLRVIDFDGRVVRTLLDAERGPGELVRRWRGRDAAGRRVFTGPYRVEATATSPDGVVGRSDAWLTVADRAAYPAAPGLVTVVVDPGHGGRFDGAVAPDGTREADLNLDIGLRLARMLEGAGVGVVLTRDADRQVDMPAIDRIPDGAVDVTDDLAARADLANAVRADLFIAIHNNFAVDTATGGPSTYYSDARPFTARSRRLARIIQTHMMTALASVAGRGPDPFDHGALPYPYYVLRDYDPPRLLRPTQMPGVLSEGLFLSNPGELRMLRRPRVRQAMAAAYYEAVAEYLDVRGSQVGYALVEGPPQVGAGMRAELEVEVRNQGSTTLAGWRLVVGGQRAGSTDLGRARPGRTLGEQRVPTLGRGERRRIRVALTAPAEPGSWVLLVDARDRTGVRASRSGSTMLPVPLRVVAAVPTDPALPAVRPDPSPEAPAASVRSP
ncbi:MAG: N-acetylmuramoyl-L-alanine amidase [Chloroflexota bacterium]